MLISHSYVSFTRGYWKRISASLCFKKRSQFHDDASRWKLIAIEVNPLFALDQEADVQCYSGWWWWWWRQLRQLLWSVKAPHVMSFFRERTSWQCRVVPYMKQELWSICWSGRVETSWRLSSGYISNGLPWYRWPDRNRWFTVLKNGGSFHGKLLNNQMVELEHLTLPLIHIDPFWSFKPSSQINLQHFWTFNLPPDLGFHIQKHPKTWCFTQGHSLVVIYPLVI